MLNRIYTIFLRQYFVYKRSPARILGVFYWAVLELFLWGSLTVYMHHLNKDLGFVSVIIGTILFWNFLVRIQQTIGISFLEDVWARNFIHLFSSPLSINEYVAGLVLTSVVTAFVSTVLMVILAWFLFVYNIFQFGLMLIPFVGILFLFGLAIGLFNIALVMRLGPSGEILVWALPAFIPALSGVAYPISALPYWIQPFSKILPSSYIFEGMRSIVLYGSFGAADLLIAFLLSFVFFTAAYWFLLVTYRYVLKAGLFARFLAD